MAARLWRSRGDPSRGRLRPVSHLRRELARYPARARFVWLPRGAETDMRAVTSSVGVA